MKLMRKTTLREVVAVAMVMMMDMVMVEMVTKTWLVMGFHGLLEDLLSEQIWIYILPEASQAGQK